MKIRWIRTVSESVEDTEEECIGEDVFRKLTSDEECRFWNGFCGGTCRRSRRRAVKGLGYVWTRIVRRDPEGRLHIDDFKFEEL